jgi:hypothetical protein
MLLELLSDITYRVRALVRRGAMDDELDAELRFHLERQAEELERHGLSRTEAMRQARLTFGGVEPMKEATRDARGTAFVEDLVKDGATRHDPLRREPLFTVAVIAILALGIGANTATFTVVNALMRAGCPCPHRDARDHRRSGAVAPAGTGRRRPTSPRIRFTKTSAIATTCSPACTPQVGSRRMSSSAKPTAGRQPSSIPRCGW